jgi:hypothetical protein
MKPRSELEIELVLVRGMLARLRQESGEDGTGILYGAQQALVWILEDKMSPSKLQDLIEEVADELAP